MTGYSDERPAKIAGHRFDEAGFAAARRPFEQDRQALPECCLEDPLLVADRHIIGTRHYLYRTSDRFVVYSRPVESLRLSRFEGFITRSIFHFIRRSLLNASRDIPPNLCGANSRTEQWPDFLAQMLRFGDGGMGRASEYAPKSFGIRGRADAQTEAANALVARLGKRPARIRCAISPLITVVVGQSVGQHDQ